MVLLFAKPADFLFEFPDSGVGLLTLLQSGSAFGFGPFLLSLGPFLLSLGAVPLVLVGQDGAAGCRVVPGQLAVLPAQVEVQCGL